MNNFIFHPKDLEAQENVPAPRPSKYYYPDWMKDMTNSWNAPNKEIRHTATGCAPFTDTFTNGYIQELPCDVKFDFTKIDGIDRVEYFCDGYKIVSQRSDIEGMPNMLPEFYGYYHVEFHWNSAWEPRTPEGYSTLYTHPLNRVDLPFQTLSGIIDTDDWSVTGPVPFLIKKGFQGVIPKGTPIYQMTFVKREDWQSLIAPFDEGFVKMQLSKLGGYKKNFWKRKEFN